MKFWDVLAGLITVNILEKNELKILAFFAKKTQSVRALNDFDQNFEPENKESPTFSSLKNKIPISCKMRRCGTLDSSQKIAIYSGH